MKQGSVLVETEMANYRPLGAFGQPVHKAYVQLDAAVRQRLGPQCANMFARPQLDERSGKIRWVAPVPGEAKAWKDLAPEDQAERALDLQIVRAEFETYLGELRAAGAAADGQSGGEAFASVLEQALKTPNDGHLHFVGEQPVMTFWGFSELSGAQFDPLRAVPAAAPVAAAATGARAVAGGSDLWWWLLPLLALIALLALLAWWLFWPDGGTDPIGRRAPDAGPETVIPDPTPEPGVPGTDPPLVQTPDGQSYDLRRLRVDRDGRVIGPDGRVIDGLSADAVREAQAGLGDGTDPGGTVPEVPGSEGDTPEITPPELGTGETPPENAGPDGTTPEDTPPGETAPDGTPPELTPPEGTAPEDPPAPDGTDPETPGPEATPDAAPPEGDGSETSPPPLGGPEGDDPGSGPDAATPDDAGKALELPPPGSDTAGTDPSAPPVPGAKPGQAGVGFLRGQWRSRSGLADEQGNRLEQTYEFGKDGQGTSTIRRADGVRCTAPAEARMDNGQLRIEERENLRCSDGQRFEKSQTVCTRGPDGKTRCKGSGFDVQIERPD